MPIVEHAYASVEGTVLGQKKANASGNSRVMTSTSLCKCTAACLGLCCTVRRAARRVCGRHATPSPCAPLRSFPSCRSHTVGVLPRRFFGMQSVFFKEKRGHPRHCTCRADLGNGLAPGLHALCRCEHVRLPSPKQRARVHTRRRPREENGTVCVCALIWSGQQVPLPDSCPFQAWQASCPRASHVCRNGGTGSMRAAKAEHARCPCG